ncbi:MAG: hypothetical protein ACK4TI_04860 [Nitrososphaerales archaeon]
MAACKHEPIYIGVVNLMNNKRAIGAVDVWMCKLCKEVFCDEKRWGETEVSKGLGFTGSKKGHRWAILVCRGVDKIEWALTQVYVGETLTHRCSSSDEAVFKVGDDFKIRFEGSPRNEHTLYLVEQYINKTISV